MRGYVSGGLIGVAIVLLMLAMSTGGDHDQMVMAGESKEIVSTFYILGVCGVSALLAGIGLLLRRTK